MIAIIDYGIENNAALLNMLHGLGVEAKIVSQEVEICGADKIILAGKDDVVTAIKKLHRQNLFSMLRMVKKPFLGIGVGAQLLCDYISEGNAAGLGVISASVEKFDQPEEHSGSFQISPVKESAILKNIEPDAKFYFTGSFYIPANEFTTSLVLNGATRSASVEKGKAFGIQFHPEDSGEIGLQVLKNFVEI